MRQDNAAYAAVKALVTIIKSVETKQEAAKALETLQTDTEMQSLMQSLAGYKELKE